MKNKEIGLRTMEGVYVPTLLTILGVIMYLRLGWIVGNAGILGALGIISIAHFITLATTFSMSSMLTNIKVGAGGAYSIVSQSLGLEMGGAIGIPLYLSQAISVAFYITGFTELWAIYFPTHPIWLVGFITWAILAGLSVYSTKIAFRMQYVILLAVILSIFSFLFGPSMRVASDPFIGSFSQAGFWATFAIFFPAVTGVLTGATMSGELQDPRKSIIRGTLGAVFTGFAVYIGIAILFGLRAPESELLGRGMIILELSASNILVIMGIMGAILSSALSTLISAPRTLGALAENRSVPYSKFFSKKDKTGAPVNAIILSSIFSVVVLMAGTLDALASLLTLFFLTTYAMINLVVLVEKLTGIISFRPSFAVYTGVPVVGFIGCIAVMFLISKVFLAVTILVIAMIYYLLQRKKFQSPWGDVRGGVFYSIAEWAAQKAYSMPYHPKLWKPSILIPVETPEDFKRLTEFTKALISPSGRLYYLSINEKPVNKERVDQVLLPLKEENLFTQQVLVEEGVFEVDFSVVLKTLSSTFLGPNTVFLTLSDDPIKQKRLMDVLDSIKSTEMGLMCLHLHNKYGTGQQRKIHLWLRDKSPNQNLAVLSALQLSKNWNAQVTLSRVVSVEAKVPEAEESLRAFVDDARLPVNTEISVYVGSFMAILHDLSTDLHIMGMPQTPEGIQFETMTRLMNDLPASIMFVSDSGLESALV